MSASNAKKSAMGNIPSGLFDSNLTYPNFGFEVTCKAANSGARTGKITTPHGTVETPNYIFCGTKASIKNLSPIQMKEAQTDIILANTYHLMIQPGADLVEKMGGLHKFMNWGKSILTDSGGFQVYSLAKLNKISDEGVKFQSHIDGSSHFITPEISMEIQRSLGADIIMAFDVCPPGEATKETVMSAVDQTTKWIKRCKDYLDNSEAPYDWNQTMFPIIQGGIYPELRKNSVEEMVPYSTCGIGIGGLAVGEDKMAMFENIAMLDELLPNDQPRYLMGVGRPTDLVIAVQNGVDMFDCVLPTRNGRNGQLFTSQGVINIQNSRYLDDFSCVDEECNCHLCNDYTKAYLRHLFNINEMLGLNKPIYECTAAYGHFGRKPRSDGSFSWEKTDKTAVFKK
jgi:queuine tRNA-ribosyltransferase